MKRQKPKKFYILCFVIFYFVAASIHLAVSDPENAVTVLVLTAMIVAPLVFWLIKIIQNLKTQEKYDFVKEELRQLNENITNNFRVSFETSTSEEANTEKTSEEEEREGRIYKIQRNIQQLLDDIQILADGISYVDSFIYITKRIKEGYIKLIEEMGTDDYNAAIQEKREWSSQMKEWFHLFSAPTLDEIDHMTIDHAVECYTLFCEQQQMQIDSLMMQNAIDRRKAQRQQKGDRLKEYIKKLGASQSVIDQISQIQAQYKD